SLDGFSQAEASAITMSVGALQEPVAVGEDGFAWRVQELACVWTRLWRQSSATNPRVRFSRLFGVVKSQSFSTLRFVLKAAPLAPRSASGGCAFSIRPWATRPAFSAVGATSM